MRHLLMDPAFPDIVGEWAQRVCGLEGPPANDNAGRDDEDELADRFLLEIARREIDATRAW
jgi:hypothetical protein